ncbi:MAG: alpha-L-fucosidase [Prevotella sp.]|jgi:alpha-L-fucosidase|nr:alpha-L-fucosidase [Prevotella sp.]
MKTNFSFLFLFSFLLFYGCAQVDAPKPYGVIPSTDQVNWQQMEYYMFVHFGPNTFTNVEWGDGKEDPKVFNPTDVDCRQWAATAKAAGMKGIIITAKHHDGFCLWPSKYSTHTVRESLWKDGKGDILKELSEACREYGLKFGVYLSPWDQNHPQYGTPEYNQVFSNTLDEVLSGYGEVFEQWFDGANGEGKDGKKQVYDWDLFHNTVYRNQPHAIIFSDVGPGCRWMGNERGVAGETNWSTLNIKGFGPGHDAPPVEVLNAGVQGGEAWVPAETDVSIRPGWFYSPATDDKVKSVDKLMDIYYTSIGRNSNLLLNVPPDRRGRIHPTDSTRLMEFRKAVDESFANDLIDGANITASNIRGNSTKFSEANLLDDNYDTYWTTEDNDLTPSLEIDLKQKQNFNRLLLQEYIPLGQRVSSFEVKYWDDTKNDWADLTKATTIGYKRILRFPTISTQKLKVSFTGLACPVISKVSIYNAPEQFSGVESANTDLKFINSSKWKLISPTADLSKITDNDNTTYLEIDKNIPLVVDMGEVFKVKGFSYVPLNKVQSSNILRYNIYVSENGKDWKQVKNNAIFNNIANNPVVQDITLFADNPESVRYLKLEPIEIADSGNKYFVAGIKVF